MTRDFFMDFDEQLKCEIAFTLIRIENYGYSSPCSTAINLPLPSYLITPYNDITLLEYLEKIIFAIGKRTNPNYSPKTASIRACLMISNINQQLLFIREQTAPAPSVLLTH